MAEEKNKQQQGPKQLKAKEEFKKKLEEMENNLAEEQKKYVRMVAEFDTFRRRAAEDRLELIANASAEVIKGLLPVLDDCERAIALLAKSSDEAAKQGTSLIYDKLMAYLKTRGLEVIEARGQKFDTDLHEAVTQFPSTKPEEKGVVIDVVQTGYKLNGKVLRYAKVVVGA
ncbi:MAG: nucleotide exchange factor GrpE [Bacteroidales bacterium]|nr:nucleotide exchange factor GrpE [Bacteroidales bacterium]